MEEFKKGFTKFAVAGTFAIGALGLMGCQTRTEEENSPTVLYNEQTSEAESNTKSAINNESNTTMNGLYTPQPDNLPEGVRFIDIEDGFADPAISGVLSGLREGTVEFVERAQEAGFTWVQEPDDRMQIEIPSTVDEEEFRNLLDNVSGADSVFWDFTNADFDAFTVLLRWGIENGGIRTYP